MAAVPMTEAQKFFFDLRGWSKMVRSEGGMPHVVRPPQQANAMRYQVAGRKIFAGLTRVVRELEEVVAGQGGTGKNHAGGKRA